MISMPPVPSADSHQDAGSAAIGRDGRRVLRELVEDPGSTTHDFEGLGARDAGLWAAATMLAALARIVADDREPIVGTQLDAVMGNAPGAAALDAVEHLPVTTSVAVTRVALRCSAGLHGEVLALTHGVDVDDDVSALLLIYRATSLAAVGLVESAADAFGRATAARGLHPRVRAFGRRQQAAVAG